MPTQSLHARIGGREAVEAVVSDFYDHVLVDDSVVHYLDDIDMVEQRARQIKLIGAVAGGLVEYDGADMRTTHDHLDPSGEGFDAIAEHLVIVLDENGVAPEDAGVIPDEVAALRAPILGQQVSFDPLPGDSAAGFDRSNRTRHASDATQPFFSPGVSLH